MQKVVINRLEKLGAKIRETKSDTLKAQIKAISFLHPLYDKEDENYGVEELIEKHRKLCDNNRESFYDMLEAYFFKRNCPDGQFTWIGKHFAPLTEGSKDYKEWASWFDDSDSVNLGEIRNVAGDGDLEFMQIMHSGGYPDYIFVCLQDPKPKNPTVFGTDHEVFFGKIGNYGKLSDYLKQFGDRRQIRKLLKEHVEAILSEQEEI